MLVSLLRENMVAIIQILRHGAHANSAYTSTSWEDYTPLCLAVKEGDDEVVQLLLKCGANVDAQGKDGKFPLHLAVAKRNEKFVQLLLEKWSQH
jgi:ankyrin